MHMNDSADSSVEVPKPPAHRTGVVVGSWPLGMPSDPRFYRRIARVIEDAGFDSLFVGDHVFAAGPIPDACATLAAFAAQTEHIAIGSAVLLVPLREPVVTAKQIATIDIIASGRFILGVGVGGEFENEWRAVGVPVEGRGRRLDEYLDLMQQLWSGDTVDHAGPLHAVSGVIGSPLPHQRPRPPIWIGGRSEPALRRAARFDGWCAYAMSPRRMRTCVHRLRELRGDLDDFRVSAVLFTVVDSDEQRARATAALLLGRRYGQDFDRYIDSFCAVGPIDHVRRRIAEYRDAGVNDVLLSPQVPADEYIDQVHQLAEVLS